MCEYGAKRPKAQRTRHEKFLRATIWRSRSLRSRPRQMVARQNFSKSASFDERSLRKFLKNFKKFKLFQKIMLIKIWPKKGKTCKNLQNRISPQKQNGVVLRTTLSRMVQWL